MILSVQSSPQTKGSRKRVLESHEFSFKIGLSAGAFWCLLKVLGCFAVFQNNSDTVLYCQYNGYTGGGLKSFMTEGEEGSVGLFFYINDA